MPAFSKAISLHNNCYNDCYMHVCIPRVLVLFKNIPLLIILVLSSIDLCNSVSIMGSYSHVVVCCVSIITISGYLGIIAVIRICYCLTIPFF